MSADAKHSPRQHPLVAFFVVPTARIHWLVTEWTAARRSLFITANQPFGEWGKIFSDQAMTLAAIDRLVHHATILEMNVESFRRKAALKRKRGPGD